MSNLPYPYTCWASANDWHRGFVILATNVNTIPSPPPRDNAIVMVDGLWGEHEWMLYPQPYRQKFPYLAWLRLLLKNAPSGILTKHVHKDMWQAHSNKSHLHIVKPRVLSDFSAKLNEVKAAVMDTFTKC